MELKMITNTMVFGGIFVLIWFTGLGESLLANPILLLIIGIIVLMFMLRKVR